MTHPLETSLVVWGDRNAPASAVGQMVKAIEASGAVDRLALSDQLLNFFPRPLWTPDVMPMAAVLPDPDSIQEAWTTAGYILASAPSMGFTLLSDSIRRGPAEFVQAMLTLANMTEGRAMFQIGAGEVKNITPYGYKRQGLGRMEDLFRFFNAVWDSEGKPFDFEGNHWSMKNATLGGARPHRPEIWGLGEGPKLLDNVTSYADGISSVMPVKYPTADKALARRDKARDLLVQKGRDPDKFRFGMLAATLIHPDENVIDRALDNRAVKWFSAMSGRITKQDWEDAGLRSPMPDDWNYYAQMKPYSHDDSFVEDVISKTTRRHCEAAWLYGTPEHVADALVPYVETGISWIGVADYLSMLLPLEEAAGAFQFAVDALGRLKAETHAGAPA